MRKWVFLVVFTLAVNSSFSQVLSCDAKLDAVSNRQYDKVLLALKKSPDVSCYRYAPGGVGNPWFPGWLIFKVAESIFGAPNGPKYDMLSLALAQPTDPLRDSLIYTIIRKKGKAYDSQINYLHHFLENKSNYWNTRMLKLVFNGAGKSAQDAGLGTAFYRDVDNYINYYIEVNGWQNSKNELAYYSMHAMRTDYFDTLLVKVGVYPANPKGIKPVEVFQLLKPHTIDDRHKNKYYNHAISEFVNRGADFNFKNAKGETALSLALQTKHNQLASVMIEKATINIQYENPKGENYLHLAAKNGDYELCRALINKGVSHTKKDKSGKFPSDYVRENDLELKELLDAKLSLRQKYTLGLYKLAQVPFENFSDYKQYVLDSIIKTDNYEFRIIQTEDSYYYPSAGTEIISIAIRNKSWYVVSKLLQLKKYDRPMFYGFDSGKELTIEDFEYIKLLVPYHKDPADHFFRQMYYKLQDLEAPDALADSLTELYKKTLLITKDEKGYFLKAECGFSPWDARYNSIEYIKNEPLLKVSKVGKWGVVSIDNQSVTDVIYDSIFFLTHSFEEFGKQFHFLGFEKEKIHFLRTGHFLNYSKDMDVELPEGAVINTLFMQSFNMILQRNGKFGYYSIRNKKLECHLEMNYDELKVYKDKLVFVRIGDKWGIHIIGRNEAPDLKYKAIDTSTGSVRVMKRKKWKYWEPFD